MISTRSLELATRLLDHNLSVSTSRLREEHPDYSPQDLLELNELASQVEDGSLSRADLWAFRSRNPNSPLASSIEGFFSYDSQSRLQDQVRTEFRQVNVEHSSHTGSTAYLSIQPTDEDTTLAPLVFIGGLHHPTRVYFETARQLALQSHRRVFLVDLPSMGGSIAPGDSSVDSGDLTRAVAAVIRQEIPQGGRVILAAHSLGTLPARAIYLNPQENLGQRVEIERVLLIAPVPSLADRHLGDQINTTFVAPYAALNVFSGFRVSPLRESLFFNGHPDSAWLSQVISREIFHNHLADTVGVFLDAYSYPSFLSLAEDEHISVIFPREDHLMNLQNPEAWAARGIYFIPGSHSSLCGRNISNEIIHPLLAALNRAAVPGQPNREPSEGRTYRTFRRDVRARLYGDSTGSLTAGQRAGFEVGLLHIPNFAGLSLNAGTEVEAGFNFGREQAFVSADVYGGLSISLLQYLPLILSSRFYAQSTANLNPEAQVYFDYGLEYSARVCLEGICPEVRVRQPLRHSMEQSENPLPVSIQAGLSLGF